MRNPPLRGGFARKRSENRRPDPSVDNAAYKLYKKFMTGRELIRLLEGYGWAPARVQGSHHIFVKGEETLVVPVHGKKDLHKGTVEAIKKKGGLK